MTKANHDLLTVREAPRGMACHTAALTAHTRVSFLACRAGALEHELVAQRGIVERIAALMGCSDEPGIARL